MIALFAPSLGGGGAERNMVNLAAGFAREGHQVSLVLATAKGPFLEEVAQGIEVTDLGVRRVASSVPALAMFLRRRRPATLLSTPTHANVAAVWARALSGVRCHLVLREANTLSQTGANAVGFRARLLPKLVRWCYPRADAIVAVSDGVARDLQHMTNLQHVRSIPNPAVTPDLLGRSREPVDHPWFGSGNPPVLLAVGSLSVQKDYPTLFEAFKRVRSQLPCRLIVLGEGPERSKLQRLAADMRIAADVDLPGFVRNPFAFMARAAALVLSSRWEGWPNVLAQSLAVGTPVASTDCPHGPREILDGGRFGELAPVGDASALAEALIRILDAPPPADLLRGRAQSFTLERAVAAYLEVLQVPER